ncbi:hypothetical protein [Saccharicrinis aurantiacus]|uniref:hypothetical protein n=1 Tax=Saccharicrinis aurantiacus TaxID=1849719 RepID=UPI00094F9E6B|nr:hypothetical protein [Saccharicrinis aurantiacus]
MIINIFMKAVKEDGTINLYLADNEGDMGKNNLTTKAKDGDQIVWKLANESSIKEITGISKKEGSKSVFSEGPAAKSSTEWTATVADDAVGVESYNIDFVYEDGTPVHVDPLVDVPPAG